MKTPRADNQDGFIPPGVNPFGGMYGPSDNDAPQRFVVSYDYTLPFYHFAPHFRRLTDDWKFVGTTTFQSGFPVRLANTAAPSDTCWGAEEVIDVICWDRPAVTGQPLARRQSAHLHVINGTPQLLFQSCCLHLGAPRHRPQGKSDAIRFTDLASITSIWRC